MMNLCCRLGAEYQSKKNVVHETNNFFVVPTIGQMGIEGYVLLCSKKHYMGIGGIPQNHLQELEEALDKTRDIISQIYSSDILVFEHGPRLGCHKGSGCLDHGHLHIVPTSVNIMEFLNKAFKPEEIAGFDRLRKICEAQNSSYMFVETQDRKRYVIEVDTAVPSQYLRQVLASRLNIASWDWRMYPDLETFNKTIKNLHGRF